MDAPRPSFPKTHKSRRSVQGGLCPEAICGFGLRPSTKTAACWDKVTCKRCLRKRARESGQLH